MGASSDTEFENFLQRLLERTDIVKLVGRHTKLKKSGGDNYSGLCPFHDEKTPSFSVSERKGMYYCFGCGAKGNAITFLKEKEGRSAAESIRELATLAGMEMPRSDTGAERRQARLKPIYDILQQAADFYQRQLRVHPKREMATEYLKGRGLDGVTAREFELGFAPPDANELIRALDPDGKCRDLLLQAGLVRRNDQGVYGFLYNRVVFPIRNRSGRIVAFGGRALDAAAKAKYLNSPETDAFSKKRELYGLHQIIRRRPRPDQLLLVEGYMDVVMLAQQGFPCAVAVLGSAVNNDHFEMMFRQAERVIVCFDGDEAGSRAAMRAVEAAMPSMEDGRELRVLMLPEGEDPDTMVRAENGPERFRKMLDENSLSLMAFLFERLGADMNADSADQRAALIHKITPYLLGCRSPVLRALLRDELADRIGIDREELKSLLAQSRPPESGPPAFDAPPHDDSPFDEPPFDETPFDGLPFDQAFEPTRGGGQRRVRTPMGRMTSLLLRHPALIEQVPVEFNAPPNDPDAKTLSALLTLLREKPLSRGQLFSLLERPEHLKLWDSLDAFIRAPVPEDHANAETELIDALEHLHRLEIDKRRDAELDDLMVKGPSNWSAEDRARIQKLGVRKK